MPAIYSKPFVAASALRRGGPLFPAVLYAPGHEPSKTAREMEDIENERKIHNQKICAAFEAASM